MANRFHFLAAPIAVVAFLYFVYVIFRHEQYLFVSGATAPDAWTLPLMLLSPVVLAYWLFGAGFLLLMGFRRHKMHTVTLSIFGIAILGVDWLVLLDIGYVHGGWISLLLLLVLGFILYI